MSCAIASRRPCALPPLKVVVTPLSSCFGVQVVEMASSQYKRRPNVLKIVHGAAKKTMLVSIPNRDQYLYWLQELKKRTSVWDLAFFITIMWWVHARLWTSFMRGVCVPLQEQLAVFNHGELLNADTLRLNAPSTLSPAEMCVPFFSNT